MPAIFFADLDSLRLALASVGVRWVDGRSALPAATNDSESAATATQSVLVLVESPPFFSLLRAFDHGPESPRAFVRQAPRVWVEAGFRHPLAEQIVPPAGQV